jgi:hypothetical protein
VPFWRAAGVSRFTAEICCWGCCAPSTPPGIGWAMALIAHDGDAAGNIAAILGVDCTFPSLATTRMAAVGYAAPAPQGTNTLRTPTKLSHSQQPVSEFLGLAPTLLEPICGQTQMAHGMTPRSAVFGLLDTPNPARAQGAAGAAIGPDAPTLPAWYAASERRWP